jgi:Retrotransposon gag protein
MGSTPGSTNTDELAKPHAFDGTKERYKAFRANMQAYIVVNAKKFTDEKVKILTVLTNIRSTPAIDEWASELVTEYCDGTRTANWNDFWTVMNDRFIDTGTEDTARRQLDDLKQGRMTATEYFDEFNRLAKNAGIKLTDNVLYPTLRGICGKNMNASLVDKLTYLDKQPDSFAKYVEKLKTFDTIYLNREAEKKSRGGVAPRVTAGTKPPSTPTPARDYKTQGLADMDVDRSRTPRNTRWTPEQAELAREGKCFHCKEKGH